MANELKSRIQLKHDTEENWLKATNFIPKEGEIVIYDVDADNPIARFKIGDGVTKVNQLSFVSHHKIISYLPQVLSEEEKAQARENVGAVSFEELNNLELSINTNKVNVSDIIDNLETNVSNKPLSAAQGVALKALIDAIEVPDFTRVQLVSWTSADIGGEE